VVAAGEAEAGVVDEEVDAAAAGGDLIDDASRCVGIAKIGGDRLHRHGEPCLEVLSERIQPLGAPRQRHDVIALGSQ
jgi:hypothetical protein